MNIEKGLDKIVKTLRVLVTDQLGYLGRLTSAIGNEKGNIGDIRKTCSGNSRSKGPFGSIGRRLQGRTGKRHSATMMLEYRTKVSAATKQLDEAMVKLKQVQTAAGI